MYGSTESSSAATLDERERYVATAWPSICKFVLGRLLGRGYEIDRPGISILTPGNLLALATAPIGAALYLLHYAPFVCRRYVLTDARVGIARGVTSRPGASIGHADYDEISLDVRPGCVWFKAADVVLKSDGDEVLRLPAVSDPETFRRTIWEVRQAYCQMAPLLAAERPRPDRSVPAAAQA